LRNLCARVGKKRTDDIVFTENPQGRGDFIILCDHASNKMPPEYDGLGLSEEDLASHIAWDPGALPVSRMLSEQLDAPLVWADVSRLVIDCNRDPEAEDLIVTASEDRPVPGNRDLPPEERQARLAHIHAPYHGAIESLIEQRLAAGLGCALVAVHSFTPVYRGQARPWQIGILFDSYRVLADRLIDALRKDVALTVGVNEPYSPADRVYYTLSRHGEQRGLPAVMIEIRNDEIAEDAGQKKWAERLAVIFQDAAGAGDLGRQA